MYFVFKKNTLLENYLLENTLFWGKGNYFDEKENEQVAN